MARNDLLGRYGHPLFHRIVAIYESFTFLEFQFSIDSVITGAIHYPKPLRIGQHLDNLLRHQSGKSVTPLTRETGHTHHRPGIMLCIARQTMHSNTYQQ